MNPVKKFLKRGSLPTQGELLTSRTIGEAVEAMVATSGWVHVEAEIDRIIALETSVLLSTDAEKFTSATAVEAKGSVVGMKRAKAICGVLIARGQEAKRLLDAGSFRG